MFEQQVDFFATIMAQQPVIPVVQIDDVAHAVPLAEALVAGGMKAIEITLRSEAALPAIKAIADALPQTIIGAGTVLTCEHYAQAVAQGAKFIVTPGCMSALFGEAHFSPVPMLPGVMTPSEMMEALHRGYTYCKFFPASAAGGMDFVKALNGPFPQIRFCPTGGITSKSAADWLSLPNVACVGGSWLAPQDLVRARDWVAITNLAQQAMQIR